MREKEFKAVFDGEKYVMSQELKYRVKNRITEKTTEKSKMPFFKRSASAMLSIVLASILVITAAAVGGIALFKSVYGDNIESIMPYSEQINLTAADANYELKLCEAVADEYTTAYIFSIKRLAGNSAAQTQDEGGMSFNGLGQANDKNGSYGVGSVSDLKVLGTFNAYDTTQIQMFTSALDSRLKVLCTNIRYDAENAANYLIRTVDSLKTEDTDYYALYVINGEDQTLSIAVGADKGPEIALPKVTQKAPSVTRSVQDYYRQYLKQTDPTVLYGSRRLADNVTITPLAIYVADKEKGIKAIWQSNIIKYIDGAFYRTAELVFQDNTEKSLSEMSQDELGIIVNKTTGVFLFNEVLDIGLVKSFLVYDTVEFPMDVNAPVIDRETGEQIVPKYETLDLMYDVGNGLASYIDSVYPADRSQNKTYCWGPSYLTENSCKLNSYDYDITLTVYDGVEGETLADAANRLFSENQAKYNWTFSVIFEKDGTFSYGDIRYVDANVSVMGGAVGEYHYFFFESNGKLLVLQLNQKSEGLLYSLDAVKQLITFS